MVSMGSARAVSRCHGVNPGPVALGCVVADRLPVAAGAVDAGLGWPGVLAKQPASRTLPTRFTARRVGTVERSITGSRFLPRG
ncbi:hypothetical protein EEZ25_26210 [Micromonospora aurantiaca]|nr:hypothetical protein EEZ25_26210 [Micromonospora aurantiaca]